MPLRNDYLLDIFLILLFSLSLLAASSRPPAFAAALQAEPVVTRSYVQEVVERHLAPIKQEIEQAQKRLAALERRLDNLAP
ncbi:MAG: hypothetical protein GX039_08645 [Clostridia bacterium]|mgnify:CR=1 FL=1|nr:hypothetical protein [Clostridia bacterium]